MLGPKEGRRSGNRRVGIDFSTQVDVARSLFLGILGHDMRIPLQPLQATAAYLAALNACERVSSQQTVL